MEKIPRHKILLIKKLNVKGFSIYNEVPFTSNTNCYTKNLKRNKKIQDPTFSTNDSLAPWANESFVESWITGFP